MTWCASRSVLVLPWYVRAQWTKQGSHGVGLWRKVVEMVLKGRGDIWELGICEKIEYICINNGLGPEGPELLQ